ncbi:response regulator transcription factor [Rarobacter faecitabidus]|uniref:LuxR family two component transcriptional regulator n=1 Tax=Rarobacter faecitabidus TaxID=13243 RepID=A0A542ZA59_RARFA|nr:response regulator transcription factor [Rarobacter faecitabidus]TQL57205.1 LuxR family two component transcriptional regulator [Rarobacter faecitabidus]
MIRIVIADDQDLIRAGLQAIIDAEPDLKVLGQARNGAEAAKLAASTGADVVLMDVQMPDSDGLEGITALAESGSPARVIVLTMFDLDDYVFRALKAGASGFLLKTTPPEELIDAIRAVHEGRRMFAPSVTDRLVSSYVAGHGGGDDSGQRLAILSERERQVFDAITKGMSNAEIGAALFLSEATVKTYVTRILGKLRLRDRVQAVILAYECGAMG